MPVILDLGCGSTKRPGAIGVDRIEEAHPDVVADLDALPLPFRDSSIDEIHLDNVLEHLQDVIATMGELHRVLRPSGRLHIVVPYFRSRWAAVDPTHRHQFTVSSMAYYDIHHPFADRYLYTHCRFRVARIIFNESWPQRGLRARMARWATTHPDQYEARLSHLFPLDELAYWLHAVK